MKNKVTLFILCICLGLNYIPVKADEGMKFTNELPSDAFMKSNQAVKPSYVDGTKALSASGVAPVSGLGQTFSTTGDLGGDTGWEDPFFPGEGGEDGDPGVTGPIGDVSPIIIISLLVLYFLYRGVTISKRRNNL